MTERSDFHQYSIFNSQFRLRRVGYRATAIFFSVDFANLLFLWKIFFICDRIIKYWAMMEIAAASRLEYVFLH